jgi:hypothetical protein
MRLLSDSGFKHQEGGRRGSGTGYCAGCCGGNFFLNQVVDNFKTDKQVPDVKLFLPVAVVKPLVVQNIEPVQKLIDCALTFPA